MAHLNGSFEGMLNRNVVLYMMITKTLRSPCQTTCRVSLVNVDLQCHVPCISFLYGACPGNTLTTVLNYMSAQSLADSPWIELKRFVDKVHKNVCVHASFKDLKTLLERNGYWTGEICRYVASVQNSCPISVLLLVPNPTARSQLILLIPTSMA